MVFWALFTEVGTLLDYFYSISFVFVYSSLHLFFVSYLGVGLTTLH